MQPNQENNVPNRPVVTRRPINANARPAGSAAARAPENAGPTFDNGPSVVGSKGGRKTGWIIAIILLLLIAAGGVGFGAWAYMDGNNTKNSLNAQITKLQQQNSELQAQIDNMAGTTSIDADGNEIDTADYIYVGEWGLKIKIPDELNKISYEFAQGHSSEIGDSTSLTVSGVVGDGLPEYADFNYNKSGLGVVTKFSRETAGSDCIGSRMVFSDDEYIYCYFHPQVLYSADGSESNIESESSVVNIIQEMLLNADNYSAI